MLKGRPRKARSLHRLWRDQQGASLLEMTVVVPFLLIVGLGTFEFGNALYKYHLITAGVRDAGRYISGAGDLNGDNDYTALDRDVATINGKKIAVYGSITSTNKRVEWWDTSHVYVRYCINGVQVGGDATPDCPCDNTLNLNGGTSKVCVSTTVPYQDLGFLSLLGPDGVLGSSGLGPITITTSHEQRFFEFGR